MPDNTLTFGWPAHGEPCCADKSPGHPVLICERPVGHLGVHAALIKGDGNTVAWPGADGGTYAVTVSDGHYDRRCTWQYQPGERCKRVEGHEGGHETDALGSRSTGAIITDAQRMETIRRIAAQMEMPPHILTQDEVDEAARLVESNPYTITVPSAEWLGSEKTVVEEPTTERVVRVQFLVTTEEGEAVNISRVLRYSTEMSDQEQAEAYTFIVESVIQAAKVLR